MLKIGILLILCTFLVQIEAKSFRQVFRPGFIDGIPLRDHYAKQFIDPVDYEKCVKTPGSFNVTIFNFTQPLDHFDSNNKGNWSQQVQYRNDIFKKRDDGDIIFLMVGGESPVPTPLLCFLTYTWGQLAVEHGAFMFQLEHRYFGTSAPTPDMNTTNLKWLTTELALADINAFIPAMNTKFNFTKPKWVAFGGSYPGTMAALLRVVYPNITNGNIASSAPLWAKVDFWEYAEKMEQAIQWESQVNKSNAACYNETKNAFSYIKTAVYTDAGRNELNSVFQPNVRLGANMSNIDLDSTNFLSGVFGIFQGIIQYTFDDRNKDTINVTGLNVANLCQYMVDTRYNYTQRLYNVYSWTAAWGGFNPVPFDNDYWNDISFWRETSFQSDAAAYRGWMWLSCNEFGWLQTTDNGYGIFQNLIPLSFYLRYCTDVFGPTINNDYIQKHVTSTSRKYGVPWRYNGTNVVLPNGSLDPWSTLGCNVSDDSVHRKVRTTVGGAHCVDMYPYTPNSTDSVEPNDVINTINLIKNETRYYVSLAGPFGGTTSGNTTSSGTTKQGSPTRIQFGYLLAGMLSYFVMRIY